MSLVGYARVSTDGQTTAAQLDALKAAGCARIFEEHESGADRDRPELARAIASVTSGDVLVVTRLDRLARSVHHLLDVLKDLNGRGAGFRSLGDPIDTTSPQGMFVFQILGAVAEFERNLIAARTTAGVQAAIARGARPGNPGLRAGDATAKAKISKAKKDAHLDKLRGTVDDWLPTVRELRPASPWDAVVKVLHEKGKGSWTVDRLKRSVRRLVAERLADAALLARAPKRPMNMRALEAAAMLRMANPQITYRQIGDALQQRQIPSPRGHSRWSEAMVARLFRVPTAPFQK